MSSRSRILIADGHNLASELPTTNCSFTTTSSRTYNCFHAAAGGGLLEFREIRRDVNVGCQQCGSSNQSKFAAEVAVRSPKLKDPDNLPLLVFPQLLVCLDCGATEFKFSDEELRLLSGTETD